MQARLFSTLRFVTVIGCLVAIAWLGVLPTQATTAPPLSPAQTSQRLQFNDIVAEAYPGQMRGSILLSWTYAGEPFPNTFLVERSINQATWTPVVSCSLSYSRYDDYSCIDSGLVSGRTYYYRFCVPTLRSRTCPYGSTITSSTAR